MFIEVSKLAVRQIVALQVARQASKVIVHNTDVDPDSITLKVGTMVVGEIAAEKASPYTDVAVERVGAWIASKRNKPVITAE
jgi:hypothetical protein